MFVTLTDARNDTPVLVNLDQVLYGFRDAGEEVTILVFGKVASSGARLRSVAVGVTETLRDIQEKRRMATG